MLKCVFVGVGGNSKHASDSTCSLKNQPNSCFSQLAEHESFKVILGCGQFACTCKNLSFSLQLLWQDGTKGRAGHIPCSCAYRTSRQSPSKVQQPSRRSQDIWSCEELDAYFPTPRHWQQITLIKGIFVCACIPLSVTITLHLYRSRMDV